MRGSRSPSICRTTCSTSVCVPSVISALGGSFLPGRLVRTKMSEPFPPLLMQSAAIFAALFFCAIDISICATDILVNSEIFSTQLFGQFVTLFAVNGKSDGFLHKSFTKPGFSLGFLCNSAKYTCCTVFWWKFIHFIKDVNLRRTSTAIFVRFLFLNYNLCLSFWTAI